MTFKKEIIELLKVADSLDSKGAQKEANLIDQLIKEASVMDYVRSLASKFGLKIPTKQEALISLSKYLHDNKAAVEEAIKTYNTVLAGRKSILTTYSGILSKTTILIVMALFVAFGEIPSSAQEASDMLGEQQEQVDTQQRERNVEDREEVVDLMIGIETYSQEWIQQIQNSEGGIYPYKTNNKMYVVWGDQSYEYKDFLGELEILHKKGYINDASYQNIKDMLNYVFQESKNRPTGSPTTTTERLQQDKQNIEQNINKHKPPLWYQ